MAKFPRIQSPCPYVADLGAIIDGDFCRMCERTVFDLTGGSDDERATFMKGCETEVCVSYRIALKPALAAAALAASVAALPAAAQDVGAAAVSTDFAVGGDEDVVIVVGGGIKDPANVEFVGDAREEDAAPELPVIYEDARRDTPVGER